MRKVVRKEWNEIGRSEIDELFRLWNRVWPREGMTIEEQIEEKAVPKGPMARWHLLHDSESLVAVARTFEREIEFADLGERKRVLALASVCSDPNLRGRGFGIAVVKDAFSRVDEGEFSLSLYQTGVPGFYEKLGARIIENRFINSLSETDPEANPWWEKFSMIYPAASTWNDGLVDLLGPGY